MQKGVSFGWNQGASKKRKLQGGQASGDGSAPAKPDPSVAQEFLTNLEVEEEKERSALEEWMRRQAATKTLCLEDAQSLSLRKQEEACILAEAERYREALSKLQQSIELTPTRAILHELQAQCYLELDEVFEAVKAAERAVEHDSSWAPGHCTLGRAQVNLGEIELAIESFRKCLELDSEEMKEVEEQDLPWALELLEKKKSLESSAAHAAAAARSEENGGESESCVMRTIVGGKVCLSAPVDKQLQNACESDILGDLQSQNGRAAQDTSPSKLS
eukprot:472776-Rhodomonas_salina.1